MNPVATPRVPISFAAAFAVAAMLTGLVGLSAAGYLVPAIALALVASLVWTGRLRKLAAFVMLINIVSGFALVLILAFGGFLGVHKLDASGVALLVNLATGGPLMGPIAVPYLWASGALRSFASRFRPNAA